MYGTTSRDGKRRTDQKPIVTAGLMCAPETWPSAKIIAVTTNANASATPACDTAPLVAAFTITAPGPISTRKNVPIASARSRRESSGASLFMLTRPAR